MATSADELGLLYMEETCLETLPILSLHQTDCLVYNFLYDDSHTNYMDLGHLEVVLGTIFNGVSN